MDKSKLEWALENASRGIRIVPLHHTKPDGSCSCGKPKTGDDRCRSPGKHPIASAWQNEATTDAATIREWFSNAPDMNYGCVAGTDKFILDVDDKDGSGVGFENAASLLGVSREELEKATFTVKTPNGGEHLYFDADRAYSNSIKTALGAGLDTRSGNGFVVGPGSVLHVPDEFEPDNFVPVAYEVVTDKDLMALPEAIRVRMREAMERSENADTSMSPDTIDSEGNIARAREILRVRDPAIQGQGGDHHTLVTAETVRDFNISEEKCFELLTEEGGWNDRCDPPWDLEELRKKVTNAYRYATRPMGSKAAGGIDLVDSDDYNSTVKDFPAGFFDTPEVQAEREAEETKRKYVLYDGSQVLLVNRHYDFIIDGWLPDKNYTIVLGGRGSGKTTVIMDAVAHAASDTKWHGTDVDPGWFFVYIAGEDFEGVKERYEAWCFDHKDLCNYNPVSQRYEIKDPRRIQFLPMAIDLCKGDEVREFALAVQAFVKDMKAQIEGEVRICFIVDTWQRMTAGAQGGQSSDEAMQLAIGNLEGLAKSFNGPCIIAAHPPKANANTMAGSSIIENRSDAIWNINPLGAGVRETKVTRIKGAEEGNWKNLHFHTVPITGIDKFQRQRQSVAVTYQRGSVVNDRGRVSSTTADWHRSQKMLEFLRDLMARKNTYNPLDARSPSMPVLNDIVTELFESKDVILANKKFNGDTGVRDEVIRKEWIEKLAELGFKETELKRPRSRAAKKTAEMPFFKAMDSLRIQCGNAGEIGQTGKGIIWRKDGNRTALTYGDIQKESALDKAEAEGAKVDRETGEVLNNDEDFGDI